jgi:hypothetical protein
MFNSVLFHDSSVNNFFQNSTQLQLLCYGLLRNTSPALLCENAMRPILSLLRKVSLFDDTVALFLDPSTKARDLDRIQYILDHVRDNCQLMVSIELRKSEVPALFAEKLSCWLKLISQSQKEIRIRLKFHYSKRFTISKTFLDNLLMGSLIMREHTTKPIIILIAFSMNSTIFDSAIESFLMQFNTCKIFKYRKGSILRIENLTIKLRNLFCIC